MTMCMDVATVVHTNTNNAVGSMTLNPADTSC
jgi:hypothetical protein